MSIGQPACHVTGFTGSSPPSPSQDTHHRVTHHLCALGDDNFSYRTAGPEIPRHCVLLCNVSRRLCPSKVVRLPASSQSPDRVIPVPSRP
ncbi:hypothetical protein RHA1_ro11251 (plasmid) [Rhodococcus jostii RHA1]|uniref:Uncharacterized protein n=1 Tax=Rhodococcus jostii (strain RHA1) TaxID=101510 RepID=Q0RUY8_RHOJR|nr:hypothetical protein RHA1_ro11251 [Rhodococcus jostii RHA1]